MVGGSGSGNTVKETVYKCTSIVQMLAKIVYGVGGDGFDGLIQNFDWGCFQFFNL